MSVSRFDVNDADLRESFLRSEVAPALDELRVDTAARWGGMTAQQMVEHLMWACECSTGRAVVECGYPAAVLPRMKSFLRDDRESPREFMNPVLASGLPALRCADLAEAKAALLRELSRFLDAPCAGDELHTHPIFGPLGYEDWHRAHCKHFRHHFSQFGLMGGD
jgi:hypothetical protein